VGEEEIAVMVGLLVYKPAPRLVNCDASASFEIAALGSAGPPVSFPRKTRSDYFSSGRLELSI